MKTFKALYIDNGIIKAGEFPVEPELCANRDDYEHVFRLCKCEEKICNYSIEIECAKANAAECEDQEEAKAIIAYELFNGPVVDVPLSRFNKKIIPFPYGWDYRVEVWHKDSKYFLPKYVAKLYRTDEQTKIEELSKKLDAFLDTQTKEQLEKWLEMDRERMKQPEPEESQDKLWMNVIILVGQNIDRQGPSKIIQQLEEQFTITRRK